MQAPPPYPWYPPASQVPKISDIQDWIRSLKDLEKSLRGEEKKDEKKPKEPKVSVFGVAALMLLLSPITGPAMYYFIQTGFHMIKGG